MRPDPSPSSSTVSGAAPVRPSAPVYVGGLDRSGKTTVSGYLASHPNIAIPAVGSNMWTYFYGQYGNLADDDNYRRCLGDLMRYKHVRFLDPDPDRITEEFRAGPSTYARLFSLFLIHYAERLGKPRWGAQTGLIERYADKLIAAYDDLRIIHMVRDPRDRYLASIERWPKGRGRAGGATARWLYSTRLGERHQRRHPDQYLLVRFEDLIEDTETTLKQICDFLGEDFVPEMLAMDGAPKHRDRLASATDGDRPDGLLSADHIGRFAEKVPAEELAYMQSRARSLMKTYGYEPVPVRRTPPELVRYGLVDWPNQFARMVAWRSAEEVQQRLPRFFGRKPGKRMIVDPPPGFEN